MPDKTKSKGLAIFVTAEEDEGLIKALEQLLSDLGQRDGAPFIGVERMTRVRKNLHGSIGYDMKAYVGLEDVDPKRFRQKVVGVRWSEDIEDEFAARFPDLAEMLRKQTAKIKESVEEAGLKDKLLQLGRDFEIDFRGLMGLMEEEGTDLVDRIRKGMGKFVKKGFKDLFADQGFEPEPFTVGVLGEDSWTELGRKLTILKQRQDIETVFLVIEFESGLRLPLISVLSEWEIEEKGVVNLFGSLSGYGLAWRPAEVEQQRPALTRIKKIAIYLKAV